MGRRKTVKLEFYGFMALPSQVWCGGPQHRETLKTHMCSGFDTGGRGSRSQEINKKKKKKINMFRKKSEEGRQPQPKTWSKGDIFFFYQWKIWNEIYMKRKEKTFPEWDVEEWSRAWRADLFFFYTALLPANLNFHSPLERLNIWIYSKMGGKFSSPVEVNSCKTEMKIFRLMKLGVQNI